MQRLAALAALLPLPAARAAELCYAADEAHAHTTAGEVCASLWNSRESSRYLYVKDNGRCDKCGHCAPTGPLQFAPSRGQGWEQISSSYGCNSNGEGISKYHEIRFDLEADVTDCMQACELDERCWAVDWRCADGGTTQYCYLFERACEEPRMRASGPFGAASYRIVPNGADTHSRPVFFDKKPEKLEVRIVEGVCGDPELKSLEYCGEHATYLVHADKDQIRLEENHPGDTEWAQSACWRVHEDKWITGFYSFESALKPDDPATEENEGYFLARNGWRMQARKYQRHNSWKGDASWRLRYPVVEEGLCKAHTDAAGHPNCVWNAAEARDPSAGFYWGEEGDEGAKEYIIGDHAFTPFGAPAFADPSEQVEGVNIEFEAGYEEGVDHIHLDPAFAAANGLSVRWDRSAGLLSIRMADESKTKPASEWAKVIAQVHFESESTELHHRKLVWNFGKGQLYSEETHHFYEFIQRRKGITWADAKAECESRVLLGQKGYLATVTSSAEIGCEKYDKENGDQWGAEGEWRWCTGPESEGMDPADERRSLMFWKGTARSGVGAWPADTTDRTGDKAELGHGYDSMYSNFNGGEPNNWGGRGENCLEYTHKGKWNDNSCTRKARGFICEWNGEGSLKDARGTVSIHMRACVEKPCNYFSQNDCKRDVRKTNPAHNGEPGGCTWYPTENVCYPRCDKEYYGALCNRHCSDRQTCSGHGRCDGEGYCKCNKGWDGPSCDWKCHKCSAWGDPHYTNFAGVKFDYHGIDKQFVVYSRPFTCTTRNKTECHDFMLYAKHYRCSGTPQNPIGCMDQVTLRDVDSGWSLQMEIDDPATPDDEHGMMWIQEGPNAPVKHIQATTLKVPYLFVDAGLSKEQQLKLKPVVLIEHHKASAKKFKFVFELPTNGEMHTRIEVQQDKSWKAPYMNVYVHHCGPLCAAQSNPAGTGAQTGCVQGLCGADCVDAGKWRTGVSKDCTSAFDVGGEFECPGKHAAPDECGQPHVPSDPKPVCLRDNEEGPPGPGQSWCVCDVGNTNDSHVMEMTAQAMQWASETCCDRFKKCGQTDKSSTGNYDQCVIEHCNMAWMGDAKRSKCLPSVEDAILHQGQCAQVLCPEGFEGEQCDRCTQDRFGKDCSAKCSAGGKCSGHGQCSSTGECGCLKGWTAEGEEDWDGDGAQDKVFCLHDCRGLTQQKCAEGVGGGGCMWIADTGRCVQACPKGKYGKDCDVSCDPASKCSGHGKCNFEGGCDCEPDWEGESCDKSERACEVSGAVFVEAFSDSGAASGTADLGSDAAAELYRTPPKVAAKGSGGMPDTIEQYGVLATTYPCGKARCLKSVALYSTAARKSVEVWLDGQLVKGEACMGTGNDGECPELCGTFSCAPHCGPPQDIAAMTRQGFFDTGAYPVPGWGKPSDPYGLPLRIVQARKIAEGQFNYRFEVGAVGAPPALVVDVLTGTENGKSMDVVVHHAVTAATGAGGPPTKANGYGGLCAGSRVPVVKTWPCPGKDDPQPPPTPNCESAGVKARVDLCCARFKGCAGDRVYKQCKEDECALGGGSKCLPGFRKRAAAEGCGCWPQQNVEWEEDASLEEGGSCSRCAEGYYGEKCDVYCNAEKSCSGHGTCNNYGGCVCADDWDDIEEGGAVRRCAVEAGCTPAAQAGAGGGWTALSSDFTCADLSGKTAKNREKVRPSAAAPQPSLAACKSTCESDPKCVQVDWWPSEGSCSIYHMPASACTGDEFIPASEALVTGEAHAFARIAAKKVCPAPPPPPCFTPATGALVRGAGSSVKITVEGSGAAPCADDCQDGEVALVQKGVTCSGATPANILQTMPSYYRKGSGAGSRAAVGELDWKVEEEGGWQLCYRSSAAGCPPWRPVLLGCASANYAPPECTFCKNGWGPEGACTKQCTRTGTCNGHGNCDFSQTGSDLCVCDDLGDLYYAHEGASLCSQTKTRVPSPPPKCDSSDCAGHEEAVAGSKPDCKCTCRNKWEGQYCTICPPAYDPNSDCSRCRAGYGGRSCEVKCDLLTHCGANAVNVVPSESGCGCECRNQWQFEEGKGCAACPSEFDEMEDCGMCKPGATQPYPICGAACAVGTHCAAANTESVAAEQGACVCKCKNQWTGAKCDACPSQYAGAACDQCAQGMSGSPPNCKACSVDRDCGPGAASVTAEGGKCVCTCRNSWVSEGGAQCNKCPENYDEFESDCLFCLPNYEPGPKGGCVRSPPRPCNNAEDCGGNAAGAPSGVKGDCHCKPCRNMWSGYDCAECDLTKYGGADCDQCREGSMGTPPDCKECTSAGSCSGHARQVQVVDGQCRCTCADRWEGTDCSTCPSIYDQATCSKCANGGDMPTCGSQTCDPALHCHGNGAALFREEVVDYGVEGGGLRLCECKCRNAWGGMQCEECPSTVGGTDCNRCAAGTYGLPPVCRPCAGYCKNSPLKITSSADRESCVCSCSGLWRGPECTECPPNTDQGCTRCIEGYEWDAEEQSCAPGAGSTPNTVQPSVFTPQAAEVGKVPCAEEGDCAVHQGGKATVRLHGQAPKNPPDCAGQAKCQEGTVRLIKKQAACAGYHQSDVLAELPVYAKAEAAQRDTEEFEVEFDPVREPFKVCYSRTPGEAPRLVPRKCPPNFLNDEEGFCGGCMANWYGSDCRTYCTRNFTCHGHGRCTPSTGACECDQGWKDGGEEEFAGKDRWEYHPAQRCFVPTSGATPEPPYFVPVTGDVSSAAPASGGKGAVNIKLQGTGQPAGAGCPDGAERCADGEVTLVRDTGSASCNSPHPSEVLTADPIPVYTVPGESGARRTAEAVSVPFDPDKTTFLVCYKPPTSAAPVAVQVPNVRGAAALSDGGGSDSGDSNTGIIVAGAVMLAAGAAAMAGAAYMTKKKPSHRRTSDPDGSYAQNLTQATHFSQEAHADNPSTFDREDV
eukprot:TRINITY_DN16912_c0_g1_i2.p1 TRINITY_DN16912_c0_g1~~TRINITY_DN16912_c0_g1_i2.p1  ORF type:complete len:2928 (+),score=961.31 TRINITY_DN16912_c0_g1_i2:96-8786(+)